MIDEKKLARMRSRLPPQFLKEHGSNVSMSAADYVEILDTLEVLWTVVGRAAILHRQLTDMVYLSPDLAGTNVWLGESFAAFKEKSR